MRDRTRDLTRKNKREKTQRTQRATIEQTDQTPRETKKIDEERDRPTPTPSTPPPQLLSALAGPNNNFTEKSKRKICVAFFNRKREKG